MQGDSQSQESSLSICLTLKARGSAFSNAFIGSGIDAFGRGWKYVRRRQSFAKRYLLCYDLKFIKFVKSLKLATMRVYASIHMPISLSLYQSSFSERKRKRGFPCRKNLDFRPTFHFVKNKKIICAFKNTSKIKSSLH